MPGTGFSTGIFHLRHVAEIQVIKMHNCSRIRAVFIGICLEDGLSIDITLCLENILHFFSMTVTASRALSGTSSCFSRTHCSAKSFACYLPGSLNLPNHVLYASGFIRRIEEQGINDECSTDIMSSSVPASH